MNTAPKVAIVGYPNVGKSTLLNRLSGKRDAVVHSQAGVTRDRKEVPVEWTGRSFTLIDTGGVDTSDRRQMARQVRSQVETAISEAALIILVVDGMTGIGPGDEDLAQIVRRSGRPALLAVNKIDDFSNAGSSIADFYALGMGDPIPVSAIHGAGSGDLLDLVVDRLEDQFVLAEAVTREEIRVAFIGRPNAGKSSMLNRLLGEERVIVSAEPGTTRDSIDTVVELEGETLRFIDTAGLRRPGKLREDVEYYSRVRALESMNKANVALIVIDTTIGLTDYDLTIIDEAMKRKCACALLINKWDVAQLDLDDLRWRLARKTTLKPPFLVVSAESGRGIKDILALIQHLYGLYISHIPTRELNKFLQEVKTEHSPISIRGRQLKMYYISQPGTAPPRIVIQVNDKGLLTKAYATYIENELRERFGYHGCPLVIQFKGKKKR